MIKVLVTDAHGDQQEMNLLMGFEEPQIKGFKLFLTSSGKEYLNDTFITSMLVIE